jgi:hypothetical protein
VTRRYEGQDVTRGNTLRGAASRSEWRRQ